MSCGCRKNSLMLFVRKVAQIDIKPSFQSSIDQQSILVIRRNISISHHLKALRASPSQTRTGVSVVSPDSNKTIADEQKLEVRVGNRDGHNKRIHREVLIEKTDWKNAPIIGERKMGAESANHVRLEAVSMENGRRGAECDVPVYSFCNTMSPNCRQNGGAGFLENTPEVIDTLASNLMSNTLSSKPHVAQSKHSNIKDLAQAIIPSFNQRHSATSAESGFEREALKNKTRHVQNSRNSGTILNNSDKFIAERVSWQIQKTALREKFKEGWKPRKRLSPDALAGIRAIHAQFPQQYTTNVLAEKFEISPEAIRRILKGKWSPKEEEEADRQRRWFARGQKIWNRYAQLGLKPPAKWRKIGIGELESRFEERQSHRGQSHIDMNITTQSSEDPVWLSQDNDREGSLSERIL